MLRAVFRLTSVLMLATLILDVTNSKASCKKSLTPKMHQFEEHGHCGKVSKRIDEWKKKVRIIPSWSGRGLTKHFPEILQQANPLLRKTLQHTLHMIKNTCLFVQSIRQRLNNSSR